MVDFFEKLKKGMDVDPSLRVQEESEPLTEDKLEPKEPEETEKASPDLAVAPIEDGDIEEEPEKPKKKKRKTKKSAPVKSSGEAKKEKKSAKKKLEIKTPASLEDSDRAGEDFGFGEEELGQLTVDLYQTDKEIVIQSVVAGVEPEDLDINIEDDLVTIKGKRERKFIEEKKNYFYQECFWGQFSREIILPVDADSSKAIASMEQGVLTIRIPKIGTETKKKIPIKT